MDEAVIRAMGKWPNVPAVYEWLSLSRRGDWLIKGERIPHRAARAFINRNYARDEDGCWFFQNGPQRVYVSLAYTPWVISADHDGKLVTHTGDFAGTPQGVWLDDEGSLLLETDYGIGVADDRDLVTLSAGLHSTNGGEYAGNLERAVAETQSGTGGVLELDWQGRTLPVDPIPRAQVAGRFGFNPAPKAS